MQIFLFEITYLRIAHHPAEAPRHENKQLERGTLVDREWATRSRVFGAAYLVPSGRQID